MTATDPDDDDAEGRVEPLPEDAEIEPPLAGDLDESDEVLTPFPGFGDHNPIFGVGGVGAFEGTRPGDVLSGTLPGVVLLEVQGRRPRASSLLLGGLGVACTLAGTFFALATADVDPSALPWPGLASRSHASLLVILAGVALLGAGLLIRLVLSGADVTFTTDGVAKHGARSDAWVPWSEVVGYRVEGEAFVTLQCPGGTLPVPTLTPQVAGEVIGLLDGREVPRLD